MPHQTELKSKIAGRLIAIRGLLLEAVPNDLIKLWRYTCERRGILLQDRVHRLDARAREKGMSTGQHLYSTAPNEKMSDR